MAVPAAVLSILVQANTGGATRGLMRFNSQLGATEAKSNRALGAVKTLAKGSAVATGIGLGYAVKKAADFEQQLDSLGSVSDASGRQMERFRKQAMKAGADTKFSALDAAVAQTELAKGGLKVRQIMRGGLAAALSLAAAGEMELGEAAATTANALNLFGLEGKSSMKVADALAKAAIATTADVTDFAMALRQSGGVAKTAGLSFSETVLALEALAKSGTKNSDAGTSLKTALIQLIKPTAKQSELAKKLNLEFIDAQGNFKNLGDISTMLRAKLGGMTAAQRTATLATLAGSDGVRTLTALYDAGPKLLDKWKKGLNESGTAAEVAAQKQDNLKGKLENLRGSIETAAIGIGTKLLPTLTKAATEITKLINDPKLTGGEKFARFMEMVTQAIEKAVPVVAEAGVKVAGALASGLARGWREMNPLMKLFTAAAVIRLVGGRGVLLKSGVAIGTALGAGVSAGAVGAAAGGAGVAAAGGGLIASMRAKVLPVAKRLGLAGVGIALADSVISEFGRRSAAKGGDLFKALKAQQGPDPLGGDLLGKADSILPGIALKDSERAARSLLPALEAIQKAQKGIGHDRAEALRKEIGRLDDATPQAKRALRDLVGEFERTGFKAKAVDSAIERMKTGSSKSIQSLRTNVRFNTRLIRNALGEDTEAGRKALNRNFMAAVANVRRSMREAGGATKQGTAEIERLMVAALQNMGFTKEQALDARASKKSGSRNAPGAPGQGARPNQRGGPIMEGALSGDSVPSILERGEYVLNRKAVRAVGRSKLDQINFKHAPRFQSGGMVRIPGDPNTTGGRDLVAAGIAEQVGSWLRRFKMQVGYAYDPGGGHLSPGHNVTGTALDVVPGIGGSWDTLEAGMKAAISAGKTVLYGTNGVGTPWPNHGRGNHAHVEWGGGGGVSGSAPGAIMGKHIKRLLVDGPDSLLKANVQGALDVSRDAANMVIDRANQSLASSAGTAGPHSVPASLKGLGGSSAQNIALGRKMAARYGWTGGEFGALIELWTRESGWSQSAHNPSSGAHGIPQSLPASKMASAGADYMTNPATQIAWGLNYIKGRYGSPSAALSFHDSHNWYQKGGLAGMQAGGSVRALQTGGDVESKWGQSINAKEMPSFMKAIWGQARELGFGGPMPKFMRGKLRNKGAYGEWDPASNAIHMSKKALGALGNAQAPNRDYALNTLLHEMAHSQQVELPKREMEGGADVWAHWAANKIFPALGIDQTTMPPYGYPAFASWVAKNKPERWWQKGQFGLKKGGMIDKLAYAGDSLGVGTLGAGLKGKLGKINLASRAKGGEPSSWGVGALKGLMGKGVGAAMLDMGTNDGTAANLRPSIGAVENMLGNKPLMMASLDPQSTDAVKKNAAIRANADVVIPWADIAQKYASDKVHPTGAGYSKRASLIAQAAKKLTADGEGSGLTDAEKKQLKTPLKGSVGKVLTKTLKVLRSNKPAKFRGTRLKQLEKRIKGMDVGLPDGLRKQITSLRAGIEEVGGNADAASNFNVDNEDGTTSLGVLRGKTEAGWVTDQLDMLFRLRNKLIDAKKIVEKHRGEVQKLIERMQKRLQALAEDIRTAAKAKREAEQHLKQLQKHPKQNKVKIRNQKAAIERIEGNQRDRVRERDAISDKILPALTGKRKQFTTFINENIMGSDGLPQIQGLGSPLEKMTALPPVGVLLGDIFDAQMRLRELAAPSTSITDSTSSETSESAELLKQLLDEANLRTAVSQKQYEVLRNMPPYGGQFATGGVVPGPIGAARTIVAHGGETVTPPGNGAPNIQINLGAGMEWLDKYIEVKVDGVTRKQARAGARGLPGRGGGF